MSLSEQEIAKVMSLRLTPCWWTLGLLIPTFVAVIVVDSQTSQAGEVVGLTAGVCLLGLAFSFVYWMDEWVEFNRRPRAWIVKQFPGARRIVPWAAPETIGRHRNIIRVIAFGAGWIGVAFVLLTVLKAADIAK